MPFTYRVVHNDRHLVTFEERAGPDGDHLVAVFADPGLSAAELDELRADAFHAWGYRLEPPREWFDA